jgi:hypothetical protein
VVGDLAKVIVGGVLLQGFRDHAADECNARRF